MGYDRHHAIVVTTWDSERAAQAHAWAADICQDRRVTSILSTSINTWFTFMVGPDGSKEGWGHSDEGDRQRDRFIAWLEGQRYEDGSSPYAWVEVQYGDERGQTVVTRDSDERYREAHAMGSSVGGDGS